MHMPDVDLKEKDRELLSFSHRRKVTLPTGIEVEMVVYKFNKDENTFRRIAQSGIVGQMEYKDGWDVIKWGRKYHH